MGRGWGGVAVPFAEWWLSDGRVFTVWGIGGGTVAERSYGGEFGGNHPFFTVK